jgi:outer membrane immunogenic protein
MTKNRSVLFSTVSAMALTLSSAAYATDLNPAPAADLGPGMTVDWRGFYIGGHIGYGRSDFDFTTSEGPTSFRSGADGLAGGLLAGYNFQADHLVFGIEADITGTPWKSDLFSVSAKSSAQGRFTGLASIRGRLGYAFDEYLVFATAGVGAVDGSFADTKNKIISDFSHSGVVFGGGIERKLTEKVNIGIDALFYGVGDTQTRTSPSAKKSSTFGPDDVGVVRARLSLQF